MISFKNIIQMIKNFYSESPSTEEHEVEQTTTSNGKPVPTDVPNTEFYQKGKLILSNNGWNHKSNYWEHHSYPEFKIVEKSGVYEITPDNKDYKVLKIVKTENILKRIKEYNIYLTSKKKKITKDSFLSDFE